MSDNSDETQDDSAEYTVQLNGKEWELNEDIRQSIQERARQEYSKNQSFSCYWKRAAPSQYEEGKWEEVVHDAGDPVLVIETYGPMVPWENLDQLEVDMQQVGPDSQLDRQMDRSANDSDTSDNGNGVKRVDPSDVDGIDDSEKVSGRTHFKMTPKHFEEVPDPDGEEEDKIPEKPAELGDEPEMVYWVPNHPDIEHSWATGEAIIPVQSRVEWNVQKYADRPRIVRDKDNSHDHWESLLKSHDCDVVGELQPTQSPPSDNSGQTSKDSDKDWMDGKYNGDNWHV